MNASNMLKKRLITCSKRVIFHGKVLRQESRQKRGNLRQFTASSPGGGRDGAYAKQQPRAPVTAAYGKHWQPFAEVGHWQRHAGPVQN
jgi:hypothetical protein